MIFVPIIRLKELKDYANYFSKMKKSSFNVVFNINSIIVLDTKASQKKIPRKYKIQDKMKKMNKRNTSLLIIMGVFVIFFLSYIMLSGGSVNRPFNSYQPENLETVEAGSSTTPSSVEFSFSFPFDFNFPTGGGGGGVPGELSFIITLLVTGLIVIIMIFSVGYIAINVVKRYLSFERTPKASNIVDEREIVNKEDIEKTLTLRIIINQIISDLNNIVKIESNKVRSEVIVSFNRLEEALSYYINLARPVYLTPLEYAKFHIKGFDKPYIDSSKLLIIVKQFYEAAYREKDPSLKEIAEITSNLKDLILEEILDLELKKSGE